MIFLMLSCVLAHLHLAMSKRKRLVNSRIVKSGGIIGFTINEGVFLDHGFKSELDHLVIQKKIAQLDFYLSDYLSSKGVKAWLGIYRVN